MCNWAVLNYSKHLNRQANNQMKAMLDGHVTLTVTNCGPGSGPLSQSLGQILRWLPAPGPARLYQLAPISAPPESELQEEPQAAGTAHRALTLVPSLSRHPHPGNRDGACHSRSPSEGMVPL